MGTVQRLLAIIVLTLLSLATLHPSVWAAKPLVPVKLTAMAETPASLKGIVMAKGDKTLTVREGNTTFQVNVTDATQVTGQRDSFGKIVTGDIVRVDGRLNPEKQWLAGKIEVLFAAGGTSATPPTSVITHLLSNAPVLAGLLTVIANGGVTVTLP